MIPKLNDTPLYEVTIPSTGEIQRFRPYLVREEKVLLMAYESKDNKTIMQAIMDTIQACLPNIDVSKLSLYDIEYLFTKIRGKSVGESVPLKIKCKTCEKNNEVEVNIDALSSETFERESKIKITDSVSVLMHHPDYIDVLNDPELMNFNTKQPERVVKSVAKSIQKIYTDDSVIDTKEESEKEVLDFVESLDEKQFKKLLDFLRLAPRISFDVDFICEHCKSENKLNIQDQQTFF
jgi:hypothetical protein